MKKNDNIYLSIYFIISAVWIALSIKPMLEARFFTMFMYLVISVVTAVLGFKERKRLLSLKQ